MTQSAGMKLGIALVQLGGACAGGGVLLALLATMPSALAGVPVGAVLWAAGMLAMLVSPP